MTVYDVRLKALRDRLRDRGFDGCALLPGSNFTYYTGQFKFVDLLTTVFVIPAAGSSWADRPLLLLPGFEEYTTSKEMPYPTDTIAYERNATGYTAGFSRLAEAIDLGRRRIGVESIGIRFQETEALRTAAPGVRLEPIDDILSSIRAIKSPDEIELLRSAARLTEKALDHILTEVRPGQTEIELRNRFHRALLDVGADGPGFDSLVVSGPRGALQHAAPSDRAIAKGDPILFDVGARHKGYTADITRTVVVGSPSDEFVRIYSIVREANAAARHAARSGALAEDVDRAARDVVRAGGYVETFVHGTGHGLGMDVHEPPRIAPGDPTILQPGMVFTIEPGIYLAERLGARIEDDVAIVRDGHDRLTSFTHDLIVV